MLKSKSRTNTADVMLIHVIRVACGFAARACEFFVACGSAARGSHGEDEGNL